jgi:cytochrome c peroxidase
LYDDETFGGNGRTCLTGPSKKTGTVSPDDVKKRLAAPNDPLFLHDALDDGVQGTSRLEQHATVRFTLPLPPQLTHAHDPTGTHVTVNRGTPTTMNTPALDPVLMYDGRAPDLVEQARAAIHDHAANTVEPTEDQLEAIALFQQSPQFQTSNALRIFAAGGPAPTLPEGNTESEKRGRRVLDDVPLSPPSVRGICAICHSGPMLNTSNGKNPIPIPPLFVPAGERFQSILSGEFLPNGDPFRAYQFTDPDGNVQISVSSDPGHALVTGDFRGFPFGDIGEFKIPTLWNVRATAPYFHNNAAKSLEEVIEHYAVFFPFATPVVLPGAPPIVFSEQDKADLLAYLKLL